MKTVRILKRFDRRQKNGQMESMKPGTTVELDDGYADTLRRAKLVEYVGPEYLDKRAPPHQGRPAPAARQAPRPAAQQPRTQGAATPTKGRTLTAAQREGDGAPLASGQGSTLVGGAPAKSSSSQQGQVSQGQTADSSKRGGNKTRLADE